VTHLDMVKSGARCNTTDDEIDFGACVKSEAENIINCSLPNWGYKGKTKHFSLSN
jgi:hypothetical protein